MKFKILLFFSVVAFLTACESNENLNINITTADLVGNWNLTSQTVEDGSASLTFSGQTLTGTYSAESKDNNMTFSFSENPNKLLLTGSYKVIITKTILGQTETEEQIINTDINPITPTTWTLNSNNTITLTEETGLPSVLTVDEFSGNYLKLKGEIDETETDNGDTVTLKATIYIVLEK